MASYLINPVQILFDANGKPVSGGKIYVYAAGTTSPSSLFSDVALTVPVANPIIADSAGRYLTPFLADGDYKIIVKDASDVTLSYPGVDNYSTFVTSVGGAVPVSGGGTGATTAAAALISLGAASASDVSTLSAAVTDVANQIAGIPGGTLGAMAARADIRPVDLASDFDHVCIQKSRLTSKVVTTISDRIQYATTPTNVIGDEIFSISFTPSRDDSRIEFNAYIMLDSVDADAVYAVFYVCRDDSTNALQLSCTRIEAGGYGVLKLEHEIPSTGAGVARTFTLRGGVDSATDSVNVNTSDWGGISESSFTIKEIVNPSIS